MRKIIYKLINPINWIKAYRFHKANSKHSKASHDLELHLYSKILKNDMLHFGYFEDINIEPDTISIKQFEDAQLKYADNIVELITDKDGYILDVGCGMGGLSGMLLKKNYKVEALTPNVNQKYYIDNKYPDLTCHHKKFEDFATDKKYNTIINSESLQYINLNVAFSNVDKFLTKGGKWIIVDYFRTNINAVNKSGHIIEDFHNKVKEYGWKITYHKDITLNIMPTAKYIYLYADRFLMPIKNFAFEKLRVKKGWLYYLTNDFRITIDEKIEKEVSSIVPDIFIKDKKYLMFVIEKL